MKAARGPFVAPPGYIATLSFETVSERAFALRCRLAANAERFARDVALRARFTPAGRRRPSSAKIVKASRADYRKARRALDGLQAVCPHARRSIYSPVHCDVCKAEIGPGRYLNEPREGKS